MERPAMTEATSEIPESKEFAAWRLKHDWLSEPIAGVRALRWCKNGGFFAKFRKAQSSVETYFDF
jgi:hypothetical protein